MQNYTESNAGAGFDSNPSPGNIKDGLIDAIKSAGAAKGGTSPVDVLTTQSKLLFQV